MESTENGGIGIGSVFESQPKPLFLHVSHANPTANKCGVF